MESTATLRLINDEIAYLEAEIKDYSAKIAADKQRIEKCKADKEAECLRLLESAKPGEKSVKIDGLTITRATLTSYEGYDLSSRVFAPERKQFRQNEAEALRKKADLIEKGEGEISESGFLKYLLSIATGQEKLKKHEVTRDTVRIRGL